MESQKHTLKRAPVRSASVPAKIGGGRVYHASIFFLLSAFVGETAHVTSLAMNHHYHTKTKPQTNSKANKSQQYIYSWLQKDGGNLHLGAANKKPAQKTEPKTVREVIDLTQNDRQQESKLAPSRTSSFSSSQGSSSSGQLKPASKFNSKTYNGQNAGKPMLSSFEPQATQAHTPRQMPRVHPARPAVQARPSGMSLVGPKFNNDTIFLPKKSNNMPVVATSSPSSTSSLTSSSSFLKPTMQYSSTPTTSTNPYTYAGQKRSSDYTSCFKSEQALRSFEATGTFGIKLKTVSSSADYTPTTLYEPASKRSRTYPSPSSSPSAGSPRMLPSSFSYAGSMVTINSHSTPKLSPEQERILDMVVNQGKSIFFTGSAGTYI